MNDSPNRPAGLGFLYALLAYTSWGLLPLYWKPLLMASPLEIVSHRVLWSLLLLIVLVALSRQYGELRRLLRIKRDLLMLLLTATLLSLNWGIFVYGVVSAQVVETSLGYFLNPLVSILLACLVLKERLTRWQMVAFGLAICGVVHFGWHLGRAPWLALGLALTFALYGLFRKIVNVTPLTGLLIETAFMTPVALALIGLLASRGQAVFGHSTHHTLLFLGAGVITTLPLIWFNRATKLLPLATMGFLQYVAPSLQLTTGVLIFHEPFTHREGLSFVLIWVAIAIYLTSLLRSRPPAMPVPNAD